ncbi:MAG: hypothetical protein RL141_1105 [Candidatus Parcubacteria bacterium]|jgi:hypothetical protein
MNKRSFLATSLLAAVAVATVCGEWNERVFAAETAHFTMTITPGPECYDGQDNDEDGLIDYPDDDDCTSSNDDAEGIPPSSVPPATTGPTPSGSSGGFAVEPTTSIIFSGHAYPGSRVLLLQDAQPTAFITAGLDARFTLTLSGLSAGNYLFLLYAESVTGRRSVLHPFPLVLSKGSLTQIDGVVLNPTMELDKTVVRRGDRLQVFGDTAPQATLSMELSSGEERHYTAQADAEGHYLSFIDTAALPPGGYVLKMSATVGSRASGYGLAQAFRIGDANVLTMPAEGCGKADMNCDGRVNLLDFSVAAYWFRRPLEGPFMQIERERLNGDGVLDLRDISVMAFYWTG